MTRSRYPWWQATKTVKQGYLMAGGYLALAVLGWFNAFDTPGPLHFFVAVLSSLLCLLFVSSTLMMRSVAARADAAVRAFEALSAPDAPSKEPHQ